MRIRAAVIAGIGEAFRIVELELGDPRPDEVLVRVVSAGICRTDLHIRDHEYPVPSFPVVAGHESTGVVEAVGDSVTHVKPGDRVIASYPSCGTCPNCSSGRNPYCRNGFALSFGGSRLDGSSALRDVSGRSVNGHIFQQSSFATHAVVHQNSLVVVPPTVPVIEHLAPLACGVQTGAGAVMHALQVPPGSSVGVWGAGSVGLSAVMAAVVCGATTVVAVDTLPSRLALAEALGATCVINAHAENVGAALRRYAPAGLDFGVETTGNPRVLADALDSIAMTGELALVGAAPTGTTSPIDMGTLLNGRRLRGVIQGDAISQQFLPQLIDLHQRGRMPFDRLITYYDFEEINRAVDDMSSGVAIKPVLRMPAP